MSESIRQSNLFSAENYKKIFKAYQFIDYTAYDFDTLKQALVNYIQIYYPEDFNDYIESSEFIAIIELISYLGTSLAFRTDLNSRENFIDTAERRESIIRLAQMVNYIPRRNIPASGLFKIAAVQTNQPLTDASGNNINDLSIYWNDPNNPDWFDQFIQITNAAFSTLNPFGRPTKSGTIGSIPTDLYQLNSIIMQDITYPVTISINGQTYPVDICNPNFITNQTIFERDPDPANAFNFIYRNDSLGVSSANTGFFLLFKQGNLINLDTNFEFPVPNRVYPIDIQNINQDDVYVQETDQTGNVVNQWLKVPALAGENIIYNSIQYSERNIFDVISGANDSISIRFADGNFGNVPTGLFRTWVRISANQDLVIRPDQAQGLQITIPYIGFNQQQYTLRVTFNLEQTIGNAAASETNEQIKLRAPEVFSTQSRMVNGSDYNVLPLIYGNQIAKIQATDRTYSGQSRYIDLNDPTGFHRDLIIFGQDGALYRDNQNVLAEVSKDSSNSSTIENILVNTIQEMLRNEKVSAFFYDEYLSQFESTIRVNPPNVGRSLLDLKPAIFKITSIVGNGSVVTVNYNGPAFVLLSTVTISGVTGILGYNGPQTVTNSTPGVLLFNSLISGTGVTTYATVNDDPTAPLYWKTSPSKFKNSTGYFSTATNSTTAATLTNALETDNVQGGTYAPWGFITGGAVLEFQNNTGAQSTSVISVDQSGQLLVVNPLNPYANVGPVGLGLEVQNNSQASKIYPVFRNVLTTTEIEEIASRVTDGISFWMYYDLLVNEWHTSTATTPSIADQSQQAFKYAAPIVNSSYTEIYSNWPIYPNSGLLYVNIASNNQVATTTYDITARGRVFVFESYRDVRFYWEPNQLVIDNASGLALQDSIEIMPFVNTNSLVDNNQPVLPPLPANPYLTTPVNFNITGVFIQDDGYQDPSKVEVSLIDANNDGIADDPSGFDKIVSPTDRIVFEYYTNEISGYQSTRPWIASWGTSLEEYAGDIYVYFPVIGWYVPTLANPTPPADYVYPTSLYSPPFIANMELTTEDQIKDPGSYVSTMPGLKFVYMNEADLVFIQNISQLAFNVFTTTTISIANQVTAFFNGTSSDIVFKWNKYSNKVSDKISIVTDYFINKSFLLSTSAPGYGDYNTLLFESTQNSVTYLNGYIITNTADKYHFDKNGKVFTQNTLVPEKEQFPVYFKWSHYSPLDQRVDPAPTNIIDMIVITNSYYTEVTNWKNNNGTVYTLPTKPTTEDLRVQFQNLDQYKMVSDSIVWNSGEFKILFGSQAATELQAMFKVVKAPSTSISDNEIKTQVIQAIDAYFDIRNWDFGEKFFYTELAAFIHQQLSRTISSVVIVPTNASSQFGNLFEIVASPNQLFMSTATVNNVSIISNLTNQNMRV